MRLGLALQLHGPAVGLPPEELLLPGHAEGLPDQPVRPADQRRRLARAARRQARSASSGPTSRRTPASRPTSGRAAAASTTPSTRWSTTTAPACRWSRSSAGPTSAPPRRPARTSRELRAILVAIGASDGKMEEGSMRVDANVSVRRAGDTSSAPAARSRTSTRCARSAGPSSTRPRRQVDLLEAGERVRQETRHWDEDDGRTHTLRSKEEADDYRYFPEPDLVPLDPDAGVDRAGPRRAAGAARRAAAPAWPSAAGVEPRRRRRSSSSAASTTLALAALDAGGDAGPAADPRRAQPGRSSGPASLAPAALRRRSRSMETDGALTATQAKTVLAEMVDDRRRRPRRSPRPTASRRWTTGELEAHRRRAHRRPPRRLGASSAPARTRSMGVLRRAGHEGHAGQGRRQGRHRAPEPEEGLT